MSDFEKYYENSDYCGEYNAELIAREAFEAGKNTQQSKINDLQERIDAAIKCADLNFWNANTIEAMIMALRGQQN